MLLVGCWHELCALLGFSTLRAAECPTQSTRTRIRADVAVYTIDGTLITVDLRWDSSIAFAP